MADGWRPVHGKPGVLWCACTFCGKEVQREDGALVISHESPLCEGFAALIGETIAGRPDALKAVTVSPLKSGRDGDN